MQGAGQRRGCSTPTLPVQALGSPLHCPQAQILSVRMWHPPVRQNTLFSAQKPDQDLPPPAPLADRWAEPRLPVCLRPPQIHVIDMSL